MAHQKGLGYIVQWHPISGRDNGQDWEDDKANDDAPEALKPYGQERGNTVFRQVSFLHDKLR